jgi:hypothetical protein
MKDVLRTNWIKQGAEFLQQIFSSIYDPNAILKNLSEQDICLDIKDLIDSERNAVDLNDQQDSKGQISFTSFKIWNILDKIFVQIHVQLHAQFKKFSNFSCMQSSFEMCLPLTEFRL